MRTREDATAVNPPAWDILVWRPQTKTFERHGRVETLPQDPDARFLTHAADLQYLFPDLSMNDVERMVLQVSGKRPTRAKAKGDPYLRLWWALRHMPMTIDEQVSRGPVPRDPSRIATKAKKHQGRRIIKPLSTTSRIAPSGTSHPDSPLGTQRYFLMYIPGNVELHDLLFADLSPLQQAIIKALLETGKTEFSRRELADILEASKEVKSRTDASPWTAFIRYRANLVRLGFIAEAPPPGSKHYAGDFKPVRPPLPRHRRPTGPRK